MVDLGSGILRFLLSSGHVVWDACQVLALGLAEWSTHEHRLVWAYSRSHSPDRQ